MYYADLSKYEYFPKLGGENVVNIGWLERGKHFSKGNGAKEDLVRNLENLLDFRVGQTRGFHVCDLCDKPSGPISHQTNDGRKLILGSAEFRVVGSERIFAAPDLILHYVDKHEYQPPTLFVETLSNSNGRYK